MARRGIGEYVPLSVSYMDDDALLGCSPLAELLYVRMLAVAGRMPTDGYLTLPQIEHRAGARLGTAAKVRSLLKELVAAGPVEEVDGGYAIRAWLKWNKSAEELGRERAKDRDRKRSERSGHPPDGGGSPPSVRTDSHRTPNGHHPDSGGNPPGVPAVSERSPASRATAHARHGTARHDTTPTEASLPRADEDPAPVRLDEPPGADIIPIGAVTAQTLVGEWLDHCQPSRPPKQVIGQVSKLLGGMLAEGIPASQVRAGLAEWHRACATNTRGQHPASLPSFVHAAQVAGNAPPPSRRSTTDERVAAGLALAEKYQALDAEAGPA